MNAREPESANAGEPEPAPAARFERLLEPSPTERWTSERVLERSRWREQPTERATEVAALQRAPTAGAGRRVRRAVAVPVLAGSAVLVAAIVVAVLFAMLQGGGTLGADDAGAAGESASEAGSGAGAAQETAAPVESNASDGDATALAEPPDGVVFVHVVGEVERPGVQELAARARVADAIEAAGGATDRAVLEAVNLARELVDGEQLVVPNAKQVRAGETQGQPGEDAAGGGSRGGLRDDGPGAETGAPLIDLNTATAAELEALPGVGPALSQRIVDWRDTNGGFASVEQLLEVSGIGPKTFEGLREQVGVR